MTDGVRDDTKPRGRMFIISTIAKPTSSMRYCVGSKSLPNTSFQKIELAQKFGETDDRKSRKRDADLRAPAAQHDDREDRRALDEVERRGRHEPLPHGKERAREAAEHRANARRRSVSSSSCRCRATGMRSRLRAALPRRARSAAGASRSVAEVGEQRQYQHEIVEEDHAVDRREFQAEDPPRNRPRRR